jgi:SAM-dependent methyltransferase
MTFTSDPDSAWKAWGEKNPYFGVISHPRFLDANLNDDSLRDFFAGGKLHVQHIYDVIRATIQPAFQPARVLDYGCGVGRIAIPLAERADTVVGVDISPAMLKQAGENCQRFNVASSVRLLSVDEMDSLEPASFGLVHSSIVFQHIPCARGEVILRKLIARLEEGGVGAIHFTYSDRRPFLRRVGAAISARVRLVGGLRNLANHLPFSAPPMQMNSYSMNRIFDILIDENCLKLHVEVSGHSAHRGAMLYFEKSLRPLL